MIIRVAKDVEDFLTERVRSGICADASAWVNNLLRSVRDQELKPFEVTPELETWLLEAANESVTPLASEDFQSIRERVRGRRPGSSR